MIFSICCNSFTVFAFDNQNNKRRNIHPSVHSSVHPSSFLFSCWILGPCCAAQVTNLLWLALMQLKLLVISNIWQNIWTKLSTVSVPICPTLLIYCGDMSVRESRTLPGLTDSAEAFPSASRGHIRSAYLLRKAKKQSWSFHFPGNPRSRKHLDWATKQFLSHVMWFFQSTVHVFVMCDIWLEPWPNILHFCTPLRPGHYKNNKLKINK